MADNPTPDQSPKQAQEQPATNQPAQKAQQDQIPQADAASPKAQTAPKKSLMTRLPKINLDTRSMVLVLAFLTVLLGGQIFIFNTFNKQLKEQQGLLEEIQSQSQSQEQISQQLSQYQEQIGKINQAFPDEVGLSEFVKVVGLHLSVFEEGQLQFDTNQPITIKEENIPFLPLTISATTTIENFSQFLGYLSNSPYLFAPQKLQLTVRQTIDEPVIFSLKGRLYVNQSLKE